MGSLSVNTTNIDQLSSDVLANEQRYSNILATLQSDINKLGQGWESPVYDEFKSLFENKLPNLEEGDDLMKKFKKKLDDASETFIENNNYTMNKIQ